MNFTKQNPTKRKKKKMRKIDLDEIAVEAFMICVYYRELSHDQWNEQNSFGKIAR